jgi:hypothetical protein
MYGPTLPLKPEQLQSLGQLLETLFGEPVRILEVQQVAVGANARTHFVCLRNGASPIGLKACDRGVVHGTEKERLVAEIASTLKIPNANRVVSATVQEIGPLVGRPVNATVWVENASKLQDLTAADIDQIKNDPRHYLFQYGQWMALGLLLGVKDRHTANWVWSAASSRLAMIDNEDCLNAGVVQDFYPGIDFVAGRSQLKTTGPLVKPGSLLAVGLRCVQKQFRFHRAELEMVLKGSAFASSYKTHFMDMTPHELVNHVFTNLA